MINRRQLLAAAGVAALGGIPGVEARRKDGVYGRVYTFGDFPVRGARVTLFSPDLLLFRETRTNKRGRFAFPRVDSGNHHLAVSAPGFQYRVVIVSVTGGVRTEDIGLIPETAAGEWSEAGQLDPALTGGSLSGTLLPDGRVFLTSDGVNAQLFDPVNGITTAVVPAPSPQSGHAAALLQDGRVLLIGGGTEEGGGSISPTTTVRAYDPAQGLWEEWAGLLEARWRPGVARLADGRLLVIGGFNAAGTPLATCEIIDPVTGQAAATGTLAQAHGLATAIPLDTGEVLCGWGAPRLYDPAAGAWMDAGPFTQPDRANLEDCPAGRTPPPGQPPLPGDRPDHLLVPLADGPAAVGLRRTANRSEPAMVEYYDVRHNTWSQGGSPRTLRSSPLALPLPDGRVLVAGGREEDPTTAEDADAWCQVPRADLLDPDRGTWRRVADMPVARTSRGISLLLPDGRMLVTGGSGEPSAAAPPGGDDGIHLYRPPYLSRGVRPVIESLSTTELKRGASFTLSLRFAQALTDVVLIGARACSGWSDGGTQRFVRLRFKSRKGTVRVAVPRKAEQLPSGHYLLFAMVDDIPSEGQLVTVP